MTSIIADLHLHSKYSRAVSKNMVLPTMAQVAKNKGIDLLTTGDFTFPAWFDHLKENLDESSEGVYRVKGVENGAQYLIGTEIACIFTQGGKGRRIHTLVFAPNLEVAQKITNELIKRKCNVKSDGRPIIPLSLIQLAELVFSIDENVVMIPAHVWTPWFGLLGSASGFNSLRECYGEYADKIHAVETGLSSNPEMNWRIGELANRSIVSFSDAHSPDKLGRELTVFTRTNTLPALGRPLLRGEDFTYTDFRLALENKGAWNIDYTIEFYPEEGKYHVDGHRNCGVSQEPWQTRKKGRICPVCGKPLTLGVLGRVEQLASSDMVPRKKMNDQQVMEYWPADNFHKPYVMLVPLKEIIAQSLGKGVGTKGVAVLYDQLLETLGSELHILMNSSLADIAKAANEKIAQGVEKVRGGDIAIRPGYDGLFGEVKIWGVKETPRSIQEQLTIF